MQTAFFVHHAKKQPAPLGDSRIEENEEQTENLQNAPDPI
jgi:hypothetical protein